MYLCLLCFIDKNPRKNIDIVIAETDHSSYVILYFQRQGKISMKLYGGYLTTAWYFVSSFSDKLMKLGELMVFKFKFDGMVFICCTSQVDPQKCQTLLQINLRSSQQNRILGWIMSSNSQITVSLTTWCN